MESIFTVKQAFSFGWTKFKENWKFLVLFSLGYFLVTILFEGLAGIDDSFDAWDIVSWIVSTFAMFSFVRITLKLSLGEKARIENVFDHSWAQFGGYFVASIIYGLVGLLGLALLIVPGVYVFVRWGYFMYPLIEEGLDPIGSLKRSWALTKGRFWKLLGFMLAVFFLNVLGVIALGIGILLTLPTSLLATVYVYQRLKALPAIAPEPHPAEVPKQ